MTDVLLARGGFLDDTALLRLHHAAQLAVRTVEAPLDGVRESDLAPMGRVAPACVVFAASLDGELLEDALASLPGLYRRHPHVAFVAMLDAGIGRGAVWSAAATMVLNAGADDVIDLGLDPLELSARVAAHVRRVRRRVDLDGDEVDGRRSDKPAGGPGHPAPAFGPPLRIDVDRRELVGHAGRVTLTSKEVLVLQMLLTNVRIVRRDELGASLWTGPWSGTKKAIDMHVANLRRKLLQVCEGEWRIETVRGEGFILTENRGLTTAG